MPGLERLQPLEAVYGYDLNRIIDALNNQRSSSSVSLAGIFVVGFGYQSVDSSFKARCRFLVPTNVTTLSKVTVSFTLQPYHGGTQGVTSTITHSHQVAQPAGAGALLTNLGQDTTGNLVSSGASITPFSVGKEYTSGAMTSGAPTGTVTANGHSHTIATDTALTETGMAQGIHIFVDGTDRTVALGGPWGGGTALDVTALDTSTYISTTGWHEFQFSSTALGGITVQVQIQGTINPSM